jgi:hypothetical protein
MTDAERYAAEAAECDEQAKRSSFPDYPDEWTKLARSYLILAEQAAVSGLSFSNGRTKRPAFRARLT